MKDIIRKRLFELGDDEYRLFQAKLMPGISLEKIVGVRTPVLRKYAKELASEPDIDSFLETLPHEYYDEYNLHGFIISQCKDVRKAVAYVDALLPYVDNWATCDLLSPVAFKKHPEEIRDDIERWLDSERPFTVRFGIEMIMSHFLDERYDPYFSERVANIRSNEYYVNMMIAWYFATALAKQWDSAIPYITERRLDDWTHNKTIQKAVESFRVSEERKQFLKTQKINIKKADRYEQ